MFHLNGLKLKLYKVPMKIHSANTKIILMPLIMAAIFLGLFAHDAHAVRVTLKRIIFEGGQRSELITIINNTAKPQAYRLGWRNLRMTEDRSLVTYEDGEVIEGLNAASDMIRFAPRRVLLEPGASQQIRFLLRRPRGLEDGEYRSHFWIRPEEPVDKYDADGTGDGSGPAVQLQILTGVTLPVFVRVGNLNVSGTVEGMTVKRRPDGSLQAKLTITRQGNRSLYGDIEFSCVDSGRQDVLKTVRGIALYTEVNRRVVDVTVPSLDEKGQCSNVKAVYKALKDDKQLNGKIIGEATAPIQ